MSIKTRKRIWSSALVMSIAMVGVLAAFLVLAGGSGITEAHEPPAGQTHAQVCADMVPAVQGLHDAFTAADAAKCAAEMDSGNGNGNGMDDEFMHATMPMDFWLEGLDNGARLNWEAPAKVAEHAMVVGYELDRDAWNQLAAHPINMYGDAKIMVYAHETSHSDLGLAYETVYTYMVRAKVHYNVEGWWNMLDCVEMNDAVRPTGDEPARGADTAGTAYCRMYDDLSAEAMPVVQRAYAALDPKMYTYYGAWSEKRSLETADSGGRLEPLLDPPSMVLMLNANPACANRITVSWSAPDYFGTVPELDENGVYVGPDYIGGERAGKEEVGEPATRVTYQVQRMLNNGAWVAVTPVGTSYTDPNVAYGNTYKYRVRAMNGASLTGAWAMVMEALMEPPEPQMPSSLVVEAVGANVELEWDAPRDTVGLWRKQSDFDRSGDASVNLQYQIEREVNDGGWMVINTQPHMYGENFADNRTQVHVDVNAPVGLVSYRVAALVNNCNISAYNEKRELDVLQSPLGSATGLSAAPGTTAGTVELTWTSGANSTRHWLAGIKVSDWRAGDFDNVIFRATTGQSGDTVPGLSSREEYAFTVISGDADGWEDTWSPIQYATPN
jgi:hypothetical protein